MAWAKADFLIQPYLARTAQPYTAAVEYLTGTETYLRTVKHSPGGVHTHPVDPALCITAEYRHYLTLHCAQHL